MDRVPRHLDDVAETELFPNPLAVSLHGAGTDVEFRCRFFPSISLGCEPEHLPLSFGKHPVEGAVVRLVDGFLFNGRPLAIEWTAEHVPAILEAWFPGVEAGPAIADVLLGDHDPSGRLPMSFPVTEGQVPIYYNRLRTGRPAEERDVDLTEPPAHDGEKYMSRYLDVANAPLYAFGHGESYTEFAYTDLSLEAETVEHGETLTVETTIENTGDRTGTDVVQLYVKDLVGSRARPVKELAGFENVDLGPGEAATVTFELTADDLAFWTADEEYAAEPGVFEVMVGHAADDVAHTERFELVA